MGTTTLTMTATEIPVMMIEGITVETTTDENDHNDVIQKIEMQLNQIKVKVTNMFKMENKTLAWSVNALGVEPFGVSVNAMTRLVCT